MVESPFNKFKEDKIRVMLIDDLDAYDSYYDDLSSAKAVLMENPSSCDPKVLSKVPYSNSYLNDMINQDVQEMQYYEHTHVDDFEDNEIHSGSNIILYSRYLLKNNRDAHEELLVYVSQTCPNSPKPREKLVVVTPINKYKRVRFVEPVTSSSNIPKRTNSLKTKDSNKPLLTSTGLKPTTSASGSKPSGNTNVVPT
uniref:Uncharacterized protein n=1 Tax=Tanacetum cinerariifolium TaxID=118510 RepID=A0A6L2KVC1_TANCI|nr:hypothetical protein [Tanacetum cinerariifolium]